jgi:3-oxoadipate enol-lactonase
MPLIYLSDIRLNATRSGPTDGPPVVFLHALGTDLTIWDDLFPHLPASLQTLRIDMRGHGASDVPTAPYSMGALITDTARVIDHFALTDAVIVGLSIGGLIAQGLAIKRMDLVRAMVLSNTAARIGAPSQWHDRIAQVRAHGMDHIADATLARWFGPKPKDRPDYAHWHARLCAQNAEGWCGCAHAIAHADFYETTATLRLPTLCIAGDRDGATPPDLVRETAGLIPGSTFHLIRGAGHLPFVEKPQDYVAALTTFLHRIGHI